MIYVSKYKSQMLIAIIISKEHKNRLMVISLMRAIKEKAYFNNNHRRTVSNAKKLQDDL